MRYKVLLVLQFTKDAVCKFVYINMYKIHDYEAMCVCVNEHMCVYPSLYL